MRGITSGPAGLARLAAGAESKASQIPAGAKTQLARAFRAVPDLSRSERPRIQPGSPGAKDLGTDLLKARGMAVLGIVSKVENTKAFTYEQIRTDSSKWSSFVKNINLELQKPDSPFRKMSGEDALALLLTLEQAGSACLAPLDGCEFAALVLNLPQLGQLSFTEQDKLQIGAFARSVVHEAAGIVPANGMDFVNLPAQDRKSLMQALMDKSLACLGAVDLGLAEADEKALRSLDFANSGLLAGGFTVIADREGRTEPEGSVMLSQGLLLPTGDLTELLQDEASAAGVSIGEMANRMMVSVISTIAHELYHASQYSQISADIGTHSEYLRAQTNQFSLAVERQYNLGSQNSSQKFVLFHHEQGAWYTTQMVRAAIAESPQMDKDVREAADFMQTVPRDFVMLEVLVGSTPPAFAVVSKQGISCAENVGTPENIMRATAKLGRDELNRVAPLWQEGSPAQSAQRSVT